VPAAEDDVELEYLHDESQEYNDAEYAPVQARKRKRGGLGARKRNQLDSTDTTLPQIDWINTTPAPPPDESPVQPSKERKKAKIEQTSDSEGSYLHSTKSRPKRRGKSSSQGQTRAIEVVDLTNDDDTGESEHAELYDDSGLENPELSGKEHDSHRPVIPVTPQKLGRVVVPSSQSPEESPLATPKSQRGLVETSIRSPLVPLSANSLLAGSGRRREEAPGIQSPEMKTKRLLPILQEVRDQAALRGTETNCQVDRDGGRHPAPTQPPPESSRPGDTTERMQRPVSAASSLGSNRGTVINDTDEEPDSDQDAWDEDDEVFSQLSDAEIPLPKQPTQKPSPRETRCSRILPDASAYDDADDPQEVPCSTQDSELSILYCRKPMPEDFGPPPGENLHFSSAGLAELFATQGDLRHERHGDAHVHGDEDDLQNFPPSSPIILVESTQPHADGDGAVSGLQQQETGPGNPMLTASQLLTDSLMASIPGPPGWMSSQNDGLRDED
jgi:hypothetical protein